MAVFAGAPKGGRPQGGPRVFEILTPEVAAHQCWLASFEHNAPTRFKLASHKEVRPRHRPSIVAGRAPRRWLLLIV